MCTDIVKLNIGEKVWKGSINLPTLATPNFVVYGTMPCWMKRLVLKLSTTSVGIYSHKMLIKISYS